jgi:hypothetical protein
MLHSIEITDNFCTRYELLSLNSIKVSKENRIYIGSKILSSIYKSIKSNIRLSNSQYEQLKKQGYIIFVR